METGAGKLTVRGQASALVEGKLRSDASSMSVDESVHGDVHMVRISTPARLTPRWLDLSDAPNILSIRLSDSVPLDLIFKTGAMRMDIDVSDVLAESVTIQTGASDLTLTLGSRVPECVVRIEAGASSIRVRVPRECGVRVEFSSGLTSVALPERLTGVSSEVKSVDVYESSGFFCRPKPHRHQDLRRRKLGENR